MGAWRDFADTGTHVHNNAEGGFVCMCLHTAHKNWSIFKWEKIFP